MIDLWFSLLKVSGLCADSYNNLLITFMLM